MNVLLATASLKHLLTFFPRDTSMQVVEPGDSLHPRSGYIDQALVLGVENVGHLLDTPVCLRRLGLLGSHAGTLHDSIRRGAVRASGD